MVSQLDDSHKFSYLRDQGKGNLTISTLSEIITLLKKIVEIIGKKITQNRSPFSYAIQK